MCKMLELVAVTAMFVGVAPIWAENQGAIVPLGEPMIHPAEVHGLALSPDGRWAATGASDNCLRLWDATTGKLRGQAISHPGPVYIPLRLAPTVGQLLLVRMAAPNCGMFRVARRWRRLLTPGLCMRLLSARMAARFLLGVMTDQMRVRLSFGM